MKNGIDWLHIEVFFNFDDEKVDHFLIWLKQVNRVVTFTNKDLAIFTGKELQIFLMNNGRMSEFEWTVDQRDVMRIIIWQMLHRYLKIPEYFMSCLLRINFKSLQTWVLKFGIKSLRNTHLFWLLCQEIFDSLHTIQRMVELFFLANLFELFFLILLH